MDNAMENLWSSNNLYDICKFYTLNPSIENLVHFSQGRPSASMRIKKIRFDESKEIIAVVPTASLQQEINKRVSEMLRPIPVIFVESSGQYFNYARSMNRGLVEGINSGAKWIIISNNDVFGIQRFPDFLQHLRSDQEEHIIVPKSRYVPKKNVWITIKFAIIPKPRSLGTILSYIRTAYNSNGFSFSRERILGVYHPKKSLVFQAPRPRPLSWWPHLPEEILAQTCKWFYNIGDFCAIPASELTDSRFDETFINGAEDLDLSVRLAQKKSFKAVDFVIGRYQGTSLSANKQLALARNLRDILNELYFLSKQ
jgi:hypothetical protein